MAKIVEEIIVIKLSKLVKDNDHSVKLSNSDSLAGVEAVVQELVGSDIIVEVMADDGN